MTILVAEIGWNFIGNLKLAKKMILAAKKSGADFVKFQIWNPKNLKSGSWDYDGRRKIYEKAFLDEKKYKILSNFAKKKSIKCFSSAFNIEGLEVLKKARDQWVKIPSHEAYNLKMIIFALNNFQKVVISAGCLKTNELKNLIKLIKSKKKFLKKAIVLHCVSSYPLIAKNCNFDKFEYLKKELGKVGYSGHYDGVEDAIYAISKGAYLVEKHFTTNKKLPGRDNKFALNEKQFKEVYSFKNLCSEFKLKKGINLQECEKDIFKNYRGRWSKNQKIN